MLAIKEYKRKLYRAEERWILSVGFFKNGPKSSGGRDFMKFQLDDEMILPFSIRSQMGLNKMEDIKYYVK